MVHLIENQMQTFYLVTDMIEKFIVYHLSNVNIIHTKIFILSLIIITGIIYMMLVLFIIDTDQLTIIINPEKPTIHVGGICQLIQFMDLSHDDQLISLFIHHRNGTNYRTDDEFHSFVLINNE
jgi:hypothetical protein